MYNDYELLDSGAGLKLERFGPVILSRPCGQATWDRARAEIWAQATAVFERDCGWLPADARGLTGAWVATINGISLRLQLTPAGHIGVFPETRGLWDWVRENLRPRHDRRPSVLNLFAYTGGATVAAASVGCAVCHVDSSKSAVTRARENVELNGLGAAPIRWIVEDVGKFLDREIRRGRSYDAILLDPPSFGRGVRGEQYRFDRDLRPTLERCRELLSGELRFVLLTSHTQGVAGAQLGRLMTEVLGSGSVATGTMVLSGANDVRSVDDGVWARWSRSE